ncbi:MAG: hypothetical protein COB73_04100 [Flavobacteriaceae bacterium]|nr:MAG: hypothetical protein COB73_04100 [Flavobacteriaceae bacterium]
MKTEYYKEERYKRAKKRVKEIKGFYWHLFWYLVVNIFITFGSTIADVVRGINVELEDLHFGMFSVWFFWGIGLVSHWLKVFGKNIIFSKDWEERKIKEYMDRDDVN